MNLEKQWFDKEAFWSETMPVLFHQGRIEKSAEEIASIVTLTGIKEKSSVLDMCCGIGRHSLEFARHGHFVTGVDRTESYLEKAKNAAVKEKLEIDFVKSDMRKYSKPGSFDLAVNLFTSFGYFDDPEDDRTVVKNLYRSLKPGGKLVVEMMGKEILARIYRERDWSTIEDYIILEDRKITNDWAMVESNWIIIKGNEKFTHKFTHRLYSAAELKSLLLSAGFSNAKAYGGLDGSVYDHNAKRLVIVGERL